MRTGADRARHPVLARLIRRLERSGSVADAVAVIAELERTRDMRDMRLLALRCRAAVGQLDYDGAMELRLLEDKYRMERLSSLGGTSPGDGTAAGAGPARNSPCQTPAVAAADDGEAPAGFVDRLVGGGGVESRHPQGIGDGGQTVEACYGPMKWSSWKDDSRRSVRPAAD